MSSDIEEALRIACDAHSGQRDKNGELYIYHPLRVMMSVEGDLNRIVAILHDVVEDSSNYGHGDILALFGAEVHAAIYALTRRTGEEYSDFILRCKENPIARVVKIADIRDNLRPGAPHLADRYEKALQVLEAC